MEQSKTSSILKYIGLGVLALAVVFLYRINSGVSYSNDLTIEVGQQMLQAQQAIYNQNLSLGSTGYSKVATSSTIVVGPQSDATLFSAQNTCAARIIGTVATPLMLSFHSAANPSGVIGFVQAASTTVAYDGGLYGCGAVTAYAVSSTTITIAESNL